MRRSGRWLAALMMLGFVSAQFISLARACTVGLDVTHSAAAAAHAVASMPADCPMRIGTAPSHTTCDTHGVPSAQADRTADARILLAPPSVLVLRLVSPSPQSESRATPPLARIASPPPSLLFSRLLI